MLPGLNTLRHTLSFFPVVGDILVGVPGVKGLDGIDRDLWYTMPLPSPPSNHQTHTHACMSSLNYLCINKNELVLCFKPTFGAGVHLFEVFEAAVRLRPGHHIVPQVIKKHHFLSLCNLLLNYFYFFWSQYEYHILLIYSGLLNT